MMMIMMTCPLLFFSRQMRFRLVSQMSQELGITEKSPDFINPYRTERDDVSKTLHHCAHVGTRVDFLVSNTHPVTPLVTPATHSQTFPFLFQVLHTAEAFQKILREEEKRRRKEEKRKEIRKGPRISRSRTEL